MLPASLICPHNFLKAIRSRSKAFITKVVVTFQTQTTPNVTILANYTERDGNGRTVVVSCYIGEGTAVLWTVHPKFTLSNPTAPLTRHLS